MVRRTQTIRRQHVFDHFVGLTVQVLKVNRFQYYVERQALKKIIEIVFTAVIISLVLIDHAQI